MSGYLQPSFDPDANLQLGRPARPFNLVQKLGVVIALVGASIDLVYYVGLFGWTPALIDRPTASNALLMIGIAMVHSRHQQPADLAPELAAARQRWLVIIISLCAIVFGVASLIEFTGAN